MIGCQFSILSVAILRFCFDFVGSRCILLVRSSRSDFAGSRRFDFAGDCSIMTVQIWWFQMAVQLAPNGD